MKKNIIIIITIITIAIVISLSIMVIINRLSMLESIKRCLPKAVKNCLRIEEKPPENKPRYDPVIINHMLATTDRMLDRHDAYVEQENERWRKHYAANKEDFQAIRENNETIKQHSDNIIQHSDNISNHLQEASTIASDQVKVWETICTLRTTDIETLCGKNNNSLGGNESQDPPPIVQTQTTQPTRKELLLQYKDELQKNTEGCLATIAELKQGSAEITQEFKAMSENSKAMHENNEEIIYNLRKAREHSNNSTILQYGIARTLSSIQEDNFLNRGNNLEQTQVTQPTRRDLLLKFGNNINIFEVNENKRDERERERYAELKQGSAEITQEFKAMQQHSDNISNHLQEASTIASDQVKVWETICTLRTTDIETLCGKNNNSLGGNEYG